MKAAAFLRTPEVQRALKLAFEALGAPISIHFVDGNREGKALAGCGQCRACAYVAEHPGGKERCGASRLAAAPYAIARNIPTGFVCHMGFACLSIPILPRTSRGLVLTLGPYCPAETASTLPRDAVEGLRAMGAPVAGVFPTPLSDVPILEPDAAAAVVEWLADTIGLLWLSLDTGPAGDDADSATAPLLLDSPSEGDSRAASTPQGAREPRGRPRRLRSKLPDNSPYRGAEIAAAIAAGNITEAGRLIRSAVGNVPDNAKRNGRLRAARAIALASAVLEAGESAGLCMDDAWERFPALVARIHALSNAEELVAAIRDLFRRTARRSVDPDLAAIDRYVIEALPHQPEIRLDELAAALGKHPTAITHRLQRKFGMSFRQYVSRLRIERAKDLLCRTRLSISDVAMRVGVDDPGNFAKLFRKFEGLTPLQYRQRYGSRQ